MKTCSNVIDSALLYVTKTKKKYLFAIHKTLAEVKCKKL